MAKKLDFSEILIRQGTISADQLAEARRVAKSSGKKVADTLTVMVEGAVLASGAPEAIRANRAVQEAYLGADAAEAG